MTAHVVTAYHRRRRRRGIALLCIVAVLSALDHAGAFGRRATSPRGYEGRVARVVHAADGDTLDIDIPDTGRTTTRIRLWGVDCPEIAHGPGESDTYFGREAAEFVRREFVGKRVRVTLDPKRSSRDRYGRLLAYLYVIEENGSGAGEGAMLNRILVDRGLAYADRRFDYLRKAEFVAAEKLAKKQQAGLWAGVQREHMPTWRQSISD